ncbi:MAG: alpha/beta hydrolase [Firmicutes bacterium]|nr:alpha/beta hydrolase [Bacillota bacterium]
MEKFNLKTDAGNLIPCEAIIPKEPTAIVIVTHGFGSCKESPTAQMMLKELPEAGFGAIAYDLPAHGTSGAENEELSLALCVKYMKTVEEYLISEYLFPRIYYFSSSFGAYTNLTYLSRESHTGDKSFLRSAAVNMPELFDRTANPAAAELLEKQGYLTIEEGGPAPVKVPLKFFEELEQNNLFEVIPEPISAAPRFDGMEFMMVHGEKDMVIDPAKAKLFSEKKSIPLEMLQNEDHTLSTNPDSPGRVAEMAVDFFSCRL